MNVQWHLKKEFLVFRHWMAHGWTEEEERTYLDFIFIEHNTHESLHHKMKFLAAKEQL